MRNKTTEVTEGAEKGFLESQNMSAKKLILFRLIMRGYCSAKTVNIDACKNWYA